MTSLKRNAEQEFVKMEPETATTMDMTNAPKPANTGEDIEDFISMISKLILTLSEGFSLGSMGSESKKVEQEQENAAAEPNIFALISRPSSSLWKCSPAYLPTSYTMKIHTAPMALKGIQLPLNGSVW
jgi:hypothetical protein